MKDMQVTKNLKTTRKGHSEPEMRSIKDHHAMKAVEPSAIRGHARGANMKAPAGHNEPPVVHAQPEVAGKTKGDAELEARLLKQRKTQGSNSMRYMDDTNTDRG